MICPCIGETHFRPRYEPPKVSSASPAKRCLGCGQSIGDLFPVWFATPCRLSDDLHGVFAAFCEEESCQAYLRESVAAFAADRMGLVEELGRVECTEEMCELARKRLESCFTVDENRSCAQCGKHSWALHRGTGEWSNAKCGRCFRVWYCGKECQRLHWHKSHMKDCVVGSISASPPPTMKAALEWAEKRLSCYVSLKPLTILYIYRAREFGLCSRPQCRVRLVPNCALEWREDVVFRHGELNLCISGALRFCSEGCAGTCLDKFGDPPEITVVEV